MAMSKKTKHMMLYAGIAVVVVGGFIMYKNQKKKQADAAAASAAAGGSVQPTPSFGSTMGSAFFGNMFGTGY